MIVELYILKHKQYTWIIISLSKYQYKIDRD